MEGFLIMKHSHTKQVGQTLIETLVTVLILALGVIALIRFQNYLSYDTSLAQQKGTATLLAASQLESLKDFQVLNNTSGYTSYQSIASGNSTVTGVTATYTITWTVTTNVNPTYKTIKVTVGWTDRYGTAQSVVLVSDVAGIDPSNSAVII